MKDWQWKQLEDKIMELEELITQEEDEIEKAQLQKEYNQLAFHENHELDLYLEKELTQAMILEEGKGE